MALLEALKLTYQELVLFPEDGKRHEIIDGEHYVTASPATKHQRVVLALGAELHRYALAKARGEVFLAPYDVVLSSVDVVEPDLIWVAAENSSIVTDDNIQGVPDLLVEVLSPSTRRTDEVVKRKLYERFGVREYWAVDPELELVKVWRLEGETYPPAQLLEAERAATLTSALLPGFELELSRLFG